MTDAPTQRVLDRFLEADGLLRAAQEHVLGLSAARVNAESSAASLATAATAISEYAEAAKTATETTLRVQEQAARALHEAEKLSRSFNSAQLLAAITALQEQVTELQQRAAATAEGLDARLTDVEQMVAPVPTSIDALGRRLTKHTSTHLAGVRAEVEALREELGSARDDAAEAQGRIEEHVLLIADRLEANISTVQAREAEEAELLSGIVDVLPKRSRRKLGR